MVLCLSSECKGVNGDRIMTCASRGHFPSKLYSASCGCKHAAGLSRLHLLGRDSVVHSVGSLLVFLQPCSFSPDTKRPRGAALAAAEGRFGAGCGFSTADSSRPARGGLPSSSSSSTACLPAAGFKKFPSPPPRHYPKLSRLLSV